MDNIPSDNLTPHQLIQRVLRCIELLERSGTLTNSEALIVRSAMILARKRLLEGR